MGSAVGFDQAQQPIAGTDAVPVLCGVIFACNYAILLLCGCGFARIILAARGKRKSGCLRIFRSTHNVTFVVVS